MRLGAMLIHLPSPKRAFGAVLSRRAWERGRGVSVPGWRKLDFKVNHYQGNAHCAQADT